MQRRRAPEVLGGVAAEPAGLGTAVAGVLVAPFVFSVLSMVAAGLIVRWIADR